MDPLIDYSDYGMKVSDIKPLFEALKKELVPIVEKIAEQEPPEDELNLDALAYQVSLDDMEQYLGVSVLPDDRRNLDKRWQAKVRDTSLQNLLGDAASMQHPYAILPRLPRFLKGGKTVNVTVVELLRNYPQLFESPAQVINSYKTQKFFSRENPALDWVIVACEALPESLERSSMEQKAFMRQYAQSFRVPEGRIRRRSLIEALYALIVINVITKENIQSKTVDITESRVGRDNFACINFGDQGVKIGDVDRTQRSPHMGVSPGW